MALSPIPFCPCDGHQTGLWYLPARWRDTTESAQGLLPAWAGSPLAGRVSRPLDGKQSFMKASPPPIPFDQQSLVALKFLSAYPLELYNQQSFSQAQVYTFWADGQ